VQSTGKITMGENDLVTLSLAVGGLINGLI
jgi:hypothetical protein